MSHIDRRSFVGTTLIGGALAASNAALTRAAAPDGDTDTSKLGQTPHTKFAVNVEMWWSGLPFLDRLRQAAALGFPAVEFWPWESKDVPAIADLTGELGLDVAQFTAWGFEPGMNVPANHDRFVETIERSCEAAKTLRCKKMTVVGGNDQPGMTQDEMHENIIVALKRAAPIAEAHDVMLILEPMNIRVDHKGHCLYGSPAPVRICREVDSPKVKINWDLYHMQITEGDLCRRLAEGFDQVGYLQLADNPGRNEPGTGEVHYNRVLRAAQELGYDGYVGLECRPRDDEATAARRVAAADVW
ncbi:MAG: TIM barrel protein [Planctomycetales bacterium]|nr:TIM barrel protein [Planctomycetales bacterium]